MKNQVLIYKGKAKEVYTTENSDQFLLVYTNNITAFNSEKHDNLDDKGITCAKISAILFKYLNNNKIATQFIKSIDEKTHLVKKLTMIPLEVVLRNFATGSIVRNYAIEEGKAFKPALIDFFYKDDKLNDPLITENQVKAFGILSEKEIKKVFDLTHQINNLLIDLFAKMNLTLWDFKLEFGFDKNRNEIILGDELSPDNMRIRDAKTSQILDKELYRQGIGNTVEGYKIFLGKLNDALKK